jgi:hypothetical protein
MPTPKWKLVVDIGMAPPKEDRHGNPTDSRVEEVLKLVTENSVSCFIRKVCRSVGGNEILLAFFMLSFAYYSLSVRIKAFRIRPTCLASKLCDNC